MTYAHGKIYKIQREVKALKELWLIDWLIMILSKRAKGWHNSTGSYITKPQLTTYRADNVVVFDLIRSGSWCKNLENRASLLYCWHLDSKLHSRLFNRYSSYTSCYIILLFHPSGCSSFYHFYIRPQRCFLVLSVLHIVEYALAFNLASHWYKVLLTKLSILFVLFTMVWIWWDHIMKLCNVTPR